MKNREIEFEKVLESVKERKVITIEELKGLCSDIPNVAQIRINAEIISGRVEVGDSPIVITTGDYLILDKDTGDRIDGARWVDVDTGEVGYEIYDKESKKIEIKTEKRNVKVVVTQTRYIENDGFAGGPATL